jgi:hypothetical protein
MCSNNKKLNPKQVPLRFHKIILLTTGIIAFQLVGCKPTSTPPIQGEITGSPQTTEVSMPSDLPPSTVLLPDGSEISLDPDAYIEIINVDGLSSGEPGHEIKLHRGQIVVTSKLPEGTWFTVFSKSNYIARVTGSIIVLLYDPITGQFMLDCVKGTCEMGPNLQNIHELSAEHQGCLNIWGNFFGPYENIDFEELSVICAQLVPTYTPTPEPLQTMDATATAACLEFQLQFPGTPCPSLDATATAACKDFELQFPGTPCP